MSLVKDISLYILSVIGVGVIFFVIDISSGGPDNPEGGDELTNLFGLLPDGFFSDTFAPYDSVIFNMVLGLVIVATIISIIWKIILWSRTD